MNYTHRVHGRKRVTLKFAATLTVLGKSMNLPYNGTDCPSQNADHHCRHKFGYGKGGSAEILASMKYMLV